MNKPYFILATLVLALSVTVSVAQTTSFTYQGRFTDGGAAANGEYDMQFKLFDFASVGAGNQVGSTIALSSVPGAIAVGGGLIAKTLYDRTRARAAKIEGEAALAGKAEDGKTSGK